MSIDRGKAIEQYSSFHLTMLVASSYFYLNKRRSTNRGKELNTTVNLCPALFATSFYAPNFETVDGAYCCWSVRGCVRGSHFFVPTVTFKPLKLES